MHKASLLKLFCALIFLFSTPLFAYKTASIKMNNPNYQIEINYPQGFVDAALDQAIEAEVDKIEHLFQQKIRSHNPPPEAPGINSLNIRYKVNFQENAVLSLILKVSYFYRGDAHPDNRLVTLNYIDGKSVSLADLFQGDTDYLKALSEISREKLAEKAKYDHEWLMEGTLPVQKNYQKWQFNESGISLIFDNYQIAPYVAGPQVLDLPVKSIQSLLKPEIKKMVWGMQ